MGEAFVRGWGGRRSAKNTITEEKEQAFYPPTNPPLPRGWEEVEHLGVDTNSNNNGKGNVDFSSSLVFVD